MKHIYDSMDVRNKTSPESSRDGNGDYQLMSESEFKGYIIRYLANELDDRGINKTIQDLTKTSVIFDEALSLVLTSGQRTVVYAGSTVEGTEITGSDTDCMNVISNMTVVVEFAESRDLDCQVFRLDTRNTRPGYAKLLPLKLENRIDDIFGRTNRNIYELVVKTESGEIVLSSEKFVQFAVEVMKSAAVHNTLGVQDMEFYPHGPCATMLDKDVRAIVKGSPYPNREMDTAFAIQLSSWPPVGKQWLERPRKYGYPSKRLLEKLSLLKCHVVPKGSSLSSTTELEWRISFLPVERELVWSWNDTQLKCYVMLKMLLKTYLDVIAPDVLSSFVMKTIMFWLGEELEPSTWRTDNLLGCVEQGLKMLKRCVEERYLPHYIVVDNDVLLGKLDDYSNVKALLHEIETILRDIVSYAVGCPGFDGLLILWKKWKDKGTEGPHRVNKTTMDMALYRDPTITAVQSQGLLFKPGYSLYLLLMQNVVKSQYLNDIEAFLDSAPESIHWQMISNAKQLTHLFLRQKCHSIAHRQNEVTEMEDVLTMARLECAAGTAADCLAGKLHFANVLLDSCSYSEAVSVLLSVFEKPVNFQYLGLCSTYFHLAIDENSKVEYSEEFSKPPDNVAIDVIFNRESSMCTPTAVKYECALLGKNDMVFYHPIVFCHFLLFVCYQKQNLVQQQTKSLENLALSVSEIGDGLHRDTSYNLLAHSYMCMGHYRKAFQTYLRSMQENPSIQNAAYYHLAVYIANCVKK